MCIITISSRLWDIIVFSSWHNCSSTKLKLYRLSSIATLNFHCPRVQIEKLYIIQMFRYNVFYFLEKRFFKNAYQAIHLLMFLFTKQKHYMYTLSLTKSGFGYCTCLSIYLHDHFDSQFKQTISKFMAFFFY